MRHANTPFPLRAAAALIVRIALILLIAPTTHAARHSDDAGEYTVSHVVDGDSLWVHTARADGDNAKPRNTRNARATRSGKERGRRLRLRLRGIDAPELCQPGGTQARDALRALAPVGQRVRLTIHARDRYGRLIADVTLLPGNINLARRMVAQGWAWSEGWRVRGGHGPYAREQQQARRAQRGLFAQDGAERPAHFRHHHGRCHTGGPRHAD